MSFTVSDVRDLTLVLAQHPEWRAEVRRLVLTDELLSLPDLVRDLAEAQQRTEQRVSELAEAQQRTELRVSGLAEAQQRTEQSIKELAEAQQRTEQQVRDLAEAQKRSEQRLDRVEVAVLELAEAQKRTEQTVAELVHVQRYMTDQLSQLRGRDLERYYRENTGVFWGRWLRPVEAVSPDVLRDTLEARLSEDELEDVMRVDVLVRGRTRRVPETPEVWLAIEVSAVVDQGDVERARRRADLLRRAGLQALPVVAGERLTEGAQAAAAQSPLVVLQDGRSQGWDEAFAKTFPAPRGQS